MSDLPASVKVKEVGPRDGLQAEAAILPTEAKLRLISCLADAGLREIEATSFVSPKAIPALADAVELFAKLDRRPGVWQPTYKNATMSPQRATKDSFSHHDERPRKPILSRNKRSYHSPRPLRFCRSGRELPSAASRAPRRSISDAATLMGAFFSRLQFPTRRAARTAISSVSGNVLQHPQDALVSGLQEPS